MNKRETILRFYSKKKDPRGRKPTGLVRDKKLNGARFTEDERAEIIAKAKASGMKQYEFILKAVQAYKER